jgi:hypothetical protein
VNWTVGLVGKRSRGFFIKLLVRHLIMDGGSIFFEYLKHVDAHIKETIILHNIAMYIEIKASVIFHHDWSNILHNGTSYTFMHIYTI